MDPTRTRTLATALADERARAERYLWQAMAALGLRENEGWSIVEFTREANGGTEIVLRPLHLHLPTPHGVECVVGVVEARGGKVPRFDEPEGP